MQSSLATRSGRIHLAATALFSTLLASTLAAQDATGQDTWGVLKLPHRVVASDQPVAPQPPAALFCDGKNPARPPLPIGPDRPQPNTPPTVEAGPQPMAGALTFFQNSVVKPSGATTSPRTPEPSTLINRDTIHHTGNWYAALSRDNGESWSYLSPYTFFPAADGGFCCDQRNIYVPSHDIAVWLIQYDQNATNGNNTYRFAIAKGRDNLRSGSASDWYYYDFQAQDMGYANGAWLDFPDLAFDGTYLHCSANVFGAGSGSVRWRMNLDNLRDAVGVAWSYSTSASLLGFSYRFANGVAASTGKMYWACHRDTSTVYVYEIPEATSTWVRSAVAIGSWTDTTKSVVGPDGRDWAGKDDGRILLGAGNASEIIFGWACAPRTGRAVPYTRIARFRTSDRTLISEQDIWNSTLAFMYPAGTSNSLGHFGITFAIGSSTSYVRNAITIQDGYQAWGTGWSVSSMSTGNSGPEINRFGDYFTVARNWSDQRTFVGNGSAQVGGPTSTYAQPRYVWFGRDDYTPTWVNLDVQSTPLSGIPITIDVTDRNGAKNGTTNFTRVFPPRQGYSLTAPSSHQVLGVFYVFDRWLLNGAGQAIDQEVLTVSDIGAVDDVVEAQYKLRRTLNVSSLNPSTGISITLSKADVQGNQSGTSAFTRYFKDGDSVTLTAPSTNPSGVAFKRWVVNGIPRTTGVLGAAVTMSATMTAVAEYYIHVTGTATAYGVGCKGSNGIVPLHSATLLSGQANIGTLIDYNLSSARVNAPAALLLGGSKTSYPPFTLPLDLTPFGMLNCTLLTSIDVNVARTTNATGLATFSILVPNDTALINAHVYTQYAVVDPGANLLSVVLTRAIDTMIGGNY